MAVVDTDLCTACGICEQVCLPQAIRVSEHAEVDPRTCIGCGECIQECPEKAISLKEPGSAETGDGGGASPRA